MPFTESVLWLDALYAQFYFILIKTLLGKNYYYADFVGKKTTLGLRKVKPLYQSYLANK